MSSSSLRRGIVSITVSITEGTSSDHPSVMEMGSVMCQRVAVPNDQQLLDHETMSFGLWTQCHVLSRVVGLTVNNEVDGGFVRAKQLHEWWKMLRELSFDIRMMQEMWSVIVDVSWTLWRIVTAMKDCEHCSSGCTAHLLFAVIQHWNHHILS